jgi:hypothetical protein
MEACCISGAQSSAMSACSVSQGICVQALIKNKVRDHVHKVCVFTCEYVCTRTWDVCWSVTCVTVH